MSNVHRVDFRQKVLNEKAELFLKHLCILLNGFEVEEQPENTTDSQAASATILPFLSKK